MKKLRSNWEANFLSAEFKLAMFMAILFSIWSEYIDQGVFIGRFFTGNRQDLYTALVALFGSLLGFSITAVSIVLGYAHSDKLAVLRESARYDDLWKTFKSAILVLALTTITTLIGLIFDKDSAPVDLILYVNVFTSLLSFFRMARCIWILNAIIAIVTKPRN
jgi:uncharacterized membrane protein